VVEHQDRVGVHHRREPVGDHQRGPAAADPVERGTHAELLEAGGVYAALWDRQREADAALEVLQRADAPVVPRPGRTAVPETEAAE